MDLSQRKGEKIWKKKKARGSNSRALNIASESISRGKAYIDEFLKQYGDVPLSQIAGIESGEPVSESWEDRPKSNIVNWLMDNSSRSLAEMVESLGCTTSYLNNKLHRDSFSLDDMIIVAYICGYAMNDLYQQ